MRVGRDERYSLSAGHPIPPTSPRAQDVIALFAAKYDSDFEPFFPTFVSDVWSLLSAASATR